MKIIFNIKRLVAVLCLLSATFAYSSFKLPPLSTDDEKLAFLLQVRKEIPKLFVDAAKYDIDLFTLLDNEAELVELLKQYPRFNELYSDKKYFNITIKPTADIWVGEVTIKPEAIKAWKDSILEKIQIVKESFLTPEALLEGINTKEILSIDPLELLNKIGRIDRTSKTKKEQIKKFKAQNIIVEKCKSKKYPKLIGKFQCISENYGEIYDKINKLPNLPSKEDIDKLVTGLSQEEKVFPQLYLAIVLKKNPNTPVPQNWEEFKNSIGQLNGEDLIYFNDRDDVLKPNLVTYFDIQDEQRLLRALDFIHKEINKYASGTISHQTKVTSEVELIQVRPEIGIFRGCIGGDCSSQFSFPYPNDPHERVFYIKTKTLKGYVSTTEVMVGEEKALYVITISGANVSAEDVELIFRGFEEAKETLGVKHIILPTLDNLAGLINFPTIKAAYENHIKKSNRSVELVYQDPAIRGAIEQYKPDSGYNTGAYDHRDKNKNGIVLLIKDNPVEVNITERLVPQDNSFSKEDLFEFIKELRSSNRKVMIDKVLNTQIAKKAFGQDGASEINNLFNLLDSCGGHDVLSIQGFKEKINDYLISLGLSENYLNSNPYLMVPGYLKCQDAFSKDNLEEAAMLAANDIKNHEDESSLFPLIESHIVELNKTSAFGKLNKRYYDKLSNPDAETREIAIKIFRKTRPADPKIYRAVVKALVDKVFPKIKPLDSEIHKAFAQALGDDDSSVRQAAAEALGYIKPTDPEVHKALAQALGDDDWLLRYAVAEALGNIKPTDPEVHKALAQALGDDDELLRYTVAKALESIKPTDPEVHKALAQALGDDDCEVREAVARALEKIKPTNQEVLLEIAKLLRHENADIRAKGAEVLKEIKPADVEIREALDKYLSL